ncbi:MAG: nucleotidyltransferase domain-containing protein [Nanoarchaeota archaeon]|nr:nucleotidyltransferase domain-containing protein [Nanoarchaeota archaeon]
MKQCKSEKILELFFEFPMKKFTLREISKLTKIPRATVHRKILNLKQQQLITKDNQASDNLSFKTRKINYFIEKIVDSGLIQDLINSLNPSCIILFGSVRKGDSVKESDIDIFVEAPLKKKINLKKYEKKLNHKIQLFIEFNMDKLQSNLFNNVVNGIKLYGSFKIK